MTHECMNNDGVMETVGRPQQWGIYFDDARSPTLRARNRGYKSEAEAQESLDWINTSDVLANPTVEHRVVAICEPQAGVWKICGGRAAVMPAKRGDHFPDAREKVQFGKPPAGSVE